MTHIKNQYDVVIVGAGVGGLVCGCYLVKSGMKVLIVEKNKKPGGYCSSFTRNGFMFDACVHSLGSLRENGIMANVLKDLNIDKSLEIKRYEPSDIIITPDYKVYFWNKLDKTIQGFQDTFPKEAKNIKRFFNFLVNCQGITFNSLRKASFKELLDRYLKDDKLKAILSISVLGNVGLSASMISAFTATTLYREFMLDGGYYPSKGGVEVLPNALMKKFNEFGGDILLSKLVNEIKVKNNQVEGVTIEKDMFIPAKYVVSNVDTRQTFLDLVGEQIISKSLIDKLNKMVPSLSMFVLYLGIDKNLNTLPPECSNLWTLPNYDIESMYTSVNNESIPEPTWYLVRTLLNKARITVFTLAPFKNTEYWDNLKDKLAGDIVERIDKFIPGIKKSIILKETTTPATLYRRTLNYRGAAYGWARMPSQISDIDFSQSTIIKNLYFAGHWVTLLQGIPGVVYMARDTAKIILRREKKYV